VAGFDLCIHHANRHAEKLSTSNHGFVEVNTEDFEQLYYSPDAQHVRHLHRIDQVNDEIVIAVRKEYKKLHKGFRNYGRSDSCAS
jgi:hypothetical protein